MARTFAVAVLAIFLGSLPRGSPPLRCYLTARTFAVAVLAIFLGSLPRGSPPLRCGSGMRKA